MVFNVVFIVGLELSGNSVQGALEGVFGRGIDHLGLLYSLVCRLRGAVAVWTNLNSGIIWGPRDEGNLAPVSVVSTYLLYSAGKPYLDPSPEAKS